MDFIEDIKRKARQHPARIVFAEGNEARVIAAAALILEEQLAEPILIKNPKTNDRFLDYAKRYAELRGVSLDEAKKEVEDPHVFATLLLEMGDAEAMIAGPSAPSKKRIIPALKLIKGKTKDHRISGAFFMILPDNIDKDAANGGVLLFADCAVNIEPNAADLAQIALDCSEMLKQFGMDPKVAMLSFSTEGSTDSPQSQKMREAAALAQEQNPKLLISNDMQVDAALIDSIGESKAPHSLVAGHANVLIFPDLEAGNIAYKLVERLAGATAIGPILLGIKKPVNELSRGSNVDDIVHLAAFTSVQVKARLEKKANKN